MATCVMTVSVSTLLTGRCGRNCLYLNWLGNKSLAKRYHWKVVLADSCCGLSLAMRSFSVNYCKSVTNHACQEGRNSPPVHSLWLLKCPCYVSLSQNQGPKCLLGNDGWAPGPDGNYVILTKRGKKRPDFTPFRQIYHFRVKYACYLHHLFHFDEICLQVIMLFTEFVRFVCPFLPHHWNIWILF